jgi:hypothetical protein
VEYIYLVPDWDGYCNEYIEFPGFMKVEKFLNKLRIC